VLVHGPRRGQPALYVALSRHRDQVLLFVARQELETPQGGRVGGRPRDAVDRLRRVTAKLGDDRPALDDLRSAPQAADRGRGDDDGADPTGRRWRGGCRFTGRGRDRQPQDPDDVAAATSPAQPTPARAGAAKPARPRPRGGALASVGQMVPPGRYRAAVRSGTPQAVASSAA
jgi:hypothetical protein